MSHKLILTSISYSYSCCVTRGRMYVSLGLVQPESCGSPLGPLDEYVQKRIVHDIERGKRPIVACLAATIQPDLLGVKWNAHCVQDLHLDVANRVRRG